MRDGKGKASKSLLEAIADDSEGDDFGFDPPKLAGPIGEPVDFGDPQADPGHGT